MCIATNYQTACWGLFITMGLLSGCQGKHNSNVEGSFPTNGMFAQFCSEQSPSSPVSPRFFFQTCSTSHCAALLLLRSWSWWHMMHGQRLNPWLFDFGSILKESWCFLFSFPVIAPQVLRILSCSVVRDASKSLLAARTCILSSVGSIHTNQSQPVSFSFQMQGWPDPP